MSLHDCVNWNGDSILESLKIYFGNEEETVQEHGNIEIYIQYKEEKILKK